MGSADASRSADLLGRNGEVYKRWAIHRWSQARIAEHYGISQQRVSQIVNDARKEVGPILHQELAEQSREVLSHIQAESLRIAELARRGAPVTAGKDGDVVEDPETGAAVRDYSGYLAAMTLAAKMDAELARRFGVNAPEKRELDVKGTVKYEIAGVDPEGDLT